MAKEEYIPLTVEVIKDWTAQEAEQKLVEKEIYVEQKLIPELRYELAVREMQERKIERMESEIDVMNLASEFFLQIKDGKFEKAYNCFALHTPGVSAELTGEGIYEGPEKLKEYYAVYFEQLAGGEGRFYRTDLTSPVIEVAQDNRTARGMWISHTMEALKRDDLKDMPDPLCLWSFCPICMDFVKEDEEWKIWHLYRFDDVKTDFVTWALRTFIPAASTFCLKTSGSSP